MRTGTRAAAMAACAVLVLAGCGSSGGGSGAGGIDLTVFAASSLTGAFSRIGEDFEGAHPGTTVSFNFGSSGDLAPQIESEGTADVFASASQRDMDDVQHGAGVTDRADFARNELVVITPPEDPAGIARLEDLARPGVQVVLAAEGVPVGDYARQALEAAGIARDVLANVVSGEGDDAALVARIATGEADAAIVYTSDVTGAAAPQLRSIEIPDHANVVVTYPIAVVKRSGHPRVARAFVRYVRGPAGQRTLRNHGFLPPPGP